MIRDELSVVAGVADPGCVLFPVRPDSNADAMHGEAWADTEATPNSPRSTGSALGRDFRW